jgi:hypothetical protein
LQSIEIHQLSPGNRDAYLEVLRLSLAYSAFEILVKVRGMHGSASLKSVDLAETYRSARLSRLTSFCWTRQAVTPFSVSLMGCIDHNMTQTFSPWWRRLATSCSTDSSTRQPLA